ncbi:MAG: signal peptidase II [bacterium]
MVFFLILFCILVLMDQFSKEAVLDGYRLKKAIFEITLVYNEGSAFGMKIFKNHEYIIINPLILVIFALFIFYKISKIKDLNFKNYYLLSFTFIFAGGIGNLLDRILHGKVVDFISIYIFPVFNLADIFITIGILIIAFLLLNEHRKINS